MYHAVFVREEGVILRTESHTPEDECSAEFLPGAVEALERLVGSGLRVVVLLSQPRGRPWTPREQASAHPWSPVSEATGAVRGSIECIHWEGRPSAQYGVCQTVNIQRISLAASERGIDLSRSYLVGDTVSDIQVGRLVGCRERYLVLTGRGRRELARCWLHGEQSFQVAFDLKAAAGDILLREQGPATQAAPSTLREMMVL